MKNQKFVLQTAMCWIVILFFVPAVFALAAFQDEDAPVAMQMKAINQALRELRRQLNDPGKATANIQLIEEMKKHVLAAQKERPSKTFSLPEADQKPFLEAYRAMLNGLLSTFDKLEEAIKANKPEEASALMEKLNEQKKEGHSKFQD